MSAGAETRTGRVSKVEILCAAATAIAIVPVWLFRWFPTQDGPSHLYNAFVLARYADPSSVVTQSYFALNLRFFPNWSAYLVMAPLTRVLPPLMAQQIVISLCIVLISAAVLYLQRSFKQAADPLALLGALLAYSYLLFMGFFNFLIGASLFAIVLGFWWRHRSGRHLLALYALLLITYLSHGLAFAAALLAIVILATVERRWRACAELSPAFVVLAADMATRTRGAREFRSLGWHLVQLRDLQPFVFFGDAHLIVARALAVLLAVAIVTMLLRSRPRPIALVTTALLVGYFVMPWGYGAGGWTQGGWINDRLLLLALLTLPAWLEVPWPRITTAVLTILVAAHLTMTTFEIAALSRRIGELTLPAGLIRSHATLQSIGNVPNLTPRTTPALHLSSYLALRPDVVDLDDYEARLADFPIVFRADAPRRPPDYLLIWRRAPVRNVVGYRAIYTTNELRLMERIGR